MFRHTLALLFLGMLALNLAGSWTLPLLDRDEPRFAEAAREMSERGDFVVPRFNGDYRFDKPPLIYWCQVACYAVFGETDWAARLPSALAGAVTVVLIALWGGRMAGESAGLWAAVMYGTCLQAMIHSKLSLADPLMILWVTAAYWAGWEILRPGVHPARERAWLLFFVALGFGFLAKGPVAWLPLATWIAGWRRRREWLAGAAWKLPAGLLLMLGMVAAWGVPAWSRTEGAFLRVGLGRHVVERSLVAMEGHGGEHWFTYLLTLPLYFGTVFLSFAPWSIRLPWLVGPWRRNRLDADQHYLRHGVLVIFVVFTLVRTKLPHYTLPAFPLLALWLATEWNKVGGPGRVWHRTAWGAAVLNLTLGLVVAPLLRPWFLTRSLVAAVAPYVRPGTQVATVDFLPPSFVWYVRRHSHSFVEPMAPEAARSFMTAPGPRMLALPSHRLDQLGPVPEGFRRLDVSGFDPGAGGSTRSPR
ncbi:MAG: glycosyltransferase family 39 protein [Verrucomicrobiae bacterium]|nr:glycosyltransferase family 39 protein [Verrucomicrobiae bacterium]